MTSRQINTVLRVMISDDCLFKSGRSTDQSEYFAGWHTFRAPLPGPLEGKKKSRPFWTSVDTAFLWQLGIYV